MGKQNRREEILSVSARLISQNGFNGTSFQEIADNTGLNKSSLFHYFKNKEELLARILEKAVLEVYSNLEKIVTNDALSPEEKLEKAFHNHLTSLIEHFDTINIYLNEIRHLSRKNQKIYLDKRKKYEIDFERIIVEMKAKGYFHGLDSKIVTFGILGMLNWCVKWLNGDGPLTVKEVSDIFSRMIVSTPLGN